MKNKAWEKILSIPDNLPEERRVRLEQAREAAVERADTDPLNYGHEPAWWAVADNQRAELRALVPEGVIHEVNLGGNRAAKSERAAKRVVEALLKEPGSRWWCCDSTEAQSRANQQRLIWKYLPVEWRNELTGSLKRTKTTKVKYSVAGGFTENCLILPNKSECFFKFYEMNVGNLEGPELDGVWADELGIAGSHDPFSWIEAFIFRLVNRNGILHVTFTPKNGYTALVNKYREGAKTVEWADAHLLPLRNDAGEVVGCKKVPRIEHCADGKGRIIYFYTSDNPFGNYAGMKEEVKNKSEEVVGIRVYGWCEKTANVQFPKFSERVHVISLNKYKEMILQKTDKSTGIVAGPRFHLVDPCSGRNWFNGWCWCPSPRKWIIYREWPSHGHADAYIPGVGDPGPWAVVGDSHDGQRGSAQETFGFGLKRYKDEILRNEKSGDKQEEIWERWMDCRYGNAAKTEREGTTTLIEQMRELEMEFLAMTGEKNILNSNDGSIDMINSALYYDERTAIGAFSAEMGRLNEPELLIVETCPNTIFALKNWTGKDGQQGACKDPIDILRGIFLSELDYIGADAFKWQGGGSYG